MRLLNRMPIMLALIVIAGIVLIVVPPPLLIFALVWVAISGLAILFKEIKLAIAELLLDQEKRLLLMALYELAYYSRPSKGGEGEHDEHYKYYPDDLYWKKASSHSDCYSAINESMMGTPNDIYQGVITALTVEGLHPYDANKLVKRLIDKCLAEKVPRWRINLVAKPVE